MRPFPRYLSIVVTNVCMYLSFTGASKSERSVFGISRVLQQIFSLQGVAVLFTLFAEIFLHSYCWQYALDDRNHENSLSWARLLFHTTSVPSRILYAPRL